MLNRTYRACIELKTGQVLWNISSSDSIYSEEIDYIIVSKTFYSYFETKEGEDTVFFSVTPTKAFHERPRTEILSLHKILFLSAKFPHQEIT